MDEAEGRALKDSHAQVTKQRHQERRGSLAVGMVPKANASQIGRWP